MGERKIVLRQSKKINIFLAMNISFWYSSFNWDKDTDF